MALTKPPAFTFNHADQVDKLVQDPDTTKAAFDSRAKQLRDYLNDTLTPDLDTEFEAQDTALANLAGEGRTTETVKGNADSLANLNTTVNNHLADNANPHNVTRTQIGAAPSGFGLGTNIANLGSGIDMQAYRATGWYYGYNVVNGPVTNQGFYFNYVPLTADNQYAAVWAISALTGDLYTCGRNNGTWSSWHKMVDANNSGPFYKGSGNPEGVVAAPVGSIYQRSDGGAGTTLYVKESGTGNTGWKAAQTT